jgi:hypothetical protein
MRVIFLDVDGVLNCAKYLRQSANGGIVGIDPYRVALLHRIIEATGAKVVVSSSWRLGDENLAVVRRSCDPFYLDRTPSLRDAFYRPETRDRIPYLNIPRGAEITTWLFNHPEVTHYAILDDERDAGIGHGDNFFKTEWHGEGLNEAIVAAVIKHLTL